MKRKTKRKIIFIMGLGSYVLGFILLYFKFLTLGPVFITLGLGLIPVALILR